MPIAAVPKYLVGRDLSTASPGLRFGMYLPLWGVDNRTKELLWTTHDINYRVAGRDREERAFKDENKTAALGQAKRLTVADRSVMEALRERQVTLAQRLGASGQILTLDARAVAPFTTGLGNEHPLENGFAFLNPYGLPYLPGSGIKGVLRQAVRELSGLLENAKWEIPSDWNAEAIDALFGREAKDGTDHQGGALTFWDVIPQIKGNALQIEVMTAHQTHYYQKGESPHESGQPNPINFLTVPPGSSFAFYVQCDRPFLQKLSPRLVEKEHWKTLLLAAFEHAFNWLGFGAKTAVGYGAMTDKPVVAKPEVSRTPGAARSNATRPVAAETIWGGARLKFNRANGTLTAEANGKQAHASAPRGEALLATLPPDTQAKVRRNEFVKVNAIVQGSSLVRVEAA